MTINDFYQKLLLYAYMYLDSVGLQAANACTPTESFFPKVSFGKKTVSESSGMSSRLPE